MEKKEIERKRNKRKKPMNYTEKQMSRQTKGKAGTKAKRE
jgi:hypothetical protein